MMFPAAQLRLLQLSSQALPIGSYAYSQGLESAIELGWIHDSRSLESWLSGILQSSIQTTDLALLRRCYSALAANDIEGLHRWDNYIVACRETKELELEELQLGYALRKLLAEIEPECLPESIVSYVACFAAAAHHWQIDVEAASLGFAYSWLENQVACAIKLIPLGQVAGQKLLSGLQSSIIESVRDSAHVADDEVGLSLPGFNIASSLHETQYSRLFRS